jgi:hypothetical protein
MIDAFISKRIVHKIDIMIQGPFYWITFIVQKKIPKYNKYLLDAYFVFQHNEEQRVIKNESNIFSLKFQVSFDS